MGKVIFFIVLMSFATSNGLVFNIDKLGIPSNLLKYVGGSLQFGTVDFGVKKLLIIMMLFLYGSLTTFSFFISFKRIEDFFFAGIAFFSFFLSQWDNTGLYRLIQY